MAVKTITETRQYLTFTLDNEKYAVEVSKISSVIEFNQFTKVPRMPPYMRGVINLRGSVLPLVDLKMKFGMEKTEKTIDTSIIVLEIDLNSELVELGILADSVQEVITLEPDEIEAPPKIGTRLNTDFILGMSKQEDSFLIILDIDRIFSEDEVSAFSDRKNADSGKAEKSDE